MLCLISKPLTLHHPAFSFYRIFAVISTSGISYQSQQSNKDEEKVYLSQARGYKHTQAPILNVMWFQDTAQHTTEWLLMQFSPDHTYLNFPGPLIAQARQSDQPPFLTLVYKHIHISLFEIS